jgi:TonB-linked SusC/RagA family outer membrane protein
MLIAFYVISHDAFAQNRTVTGTVSSEEGPLAGVNVMVHGTTYGTMTDLDGNYTLMITNPENTLLFSYIGYKTVSQSVGNRTVIDVIMEIDATQLDEVVVTGYTTQSRRNISGAVSVVDPEEISSIPASTIAGQLQGRAAGVMVTGSGLPGGDVGVRIRGYGTISEYMSEPLYIVDGIPLESNYIENLNPNDVESIQILKDASAASIYGARAANGVIIITTKSGKATDGPEISLDSYTGLQHFSEFPELLNPDQLANVIYTGNVNAGLNIYNPQYLLSDGTWGLPDYIWPQGYSIGLDGPLDESTYDLRGNPITRANHEGTNWFEEITQPAIIQNYNLAVNGGSPKGKYAISMGYYDQNGVVKYVGYNKWMARVNTVFNIKDKIRIGETFGITYQVRKNASENVMHPAIASAFTVPAIKPVFDIAGNYTGNKYNGIGGASNPVADLERYKNNRDKMFHFMGSFFIEWDILKDLTIKTSFNPVIDLTYENKYFTPKIEQDLTPTEATLYQDSKNSMNWTWYNTLTFSKTFGDRHNFQALVGTEAIENEITFFSATREGYFLQDLNYRHLDAGEKIIDNGGYSNQWSLFSLFSKVDYDFDGRYILSGTVRRDGSSRFGQNNRYALFPAFSAAWRLSGEGFMQGTGAINDLKIRIGWGQSGNQNIGNYIIHDTFKNDIQKAGYDIWGLQTQAEVGFRPAAFGNPNAKWETTTTANIGIDLSMFNNQLTATIDLYKRTTTDMLMQVPQPALMGIATAMWYNIGEMENKGIDVSLLYQNGPSRNFNWSVGINLSHYKNKILKLSYRNERIFEGPWDGDGSSHIITEGQSISMFWGYQVLGIFQDTVEVKNAAIHEASWIEDPANGLGRWKFADVDSSGTINTDDRTLIGSPHPDFTAGIPMNFRYKQFELSLFWYGSFGNDILNYNKTNTDYWNTWISSDDQKSVRILQSWGLPGVDNAQAKLPQINDKAPVRETFFNTELIEDGSYLRLNQLAFGYNFKTENWKGIGRFRIYFQGNNLFTWTHYQGLDPNVLSWDYILGFDYGYYPNVRSYMLGLNIIFK